MDKLIEILNYLTTIISSLLSLFYKTIQLIYCKLFLKGDKYYWFDPENKSKKTKFSYPKIDKLNLEIKDLKPIETIVSFTLIVLVIWFVLNLT